MHNPAVQVAAVPCRIVCLQEKRNAGKGANIVSAALNLMHRKRIKFNNSLE